MSKWFQINSRVWINREHVTCVRTHQNQTTGTWFAWYATIEGTEYNSEHSNESDALAEVMRFMAADVRTVQMGEEHGQ